MSKRISKNLFSIIDEYPDPRVVAGSLILVTTKFLACMSVSSGLRPDPDEIAVLLKNAYLDELEDLAPTSVKAH